MSQTALNKFFATELSTENSETDVLTFTPILIPSRGDFYLLIGWTVENISFFWFKHAHLLLKSIGSLSKHLILYLNDVQTELNIIFCCFTVDIL